MRRDLIIHSLKSKVSDKPFSETNGNQTEEEPLAEIARLKKEVLDQTIRADAYDEMIDIAESRFKISIRKKPGAKQ